MRMGSYSRARGLSPCRSRFIGDPATGTDDVPAHPYKVAMEVASLAPKSEVTIYPWKDSPAHIDEVVEHARRFLKAHAPVAVAR